MQRFTQRLDKLGPGRIAVAGIPFDEYSSYLRGAAAAPAAIWEAFFCDSANTCAENGVDIRDHPDIVDVGPIPFSSYPGISAPIGQLLDRGARVLSLGGDHSVTYPVLRAYARRYPDLTILHLDAHSDTYEVFEGNPHSHACPFARIMEEGLCKRLIQVGIRTLTGHQRQQTARYGIEVHELRNGIPRHLFLEGPLYLSLDLDVLDPAFAPGISHYEPGGLSVRQVLDIIHAIQIPIAGADIVEFNPSRDIQGMTAMVAAKFMRELLGKMVSDNR